MTKCQVTESTIKNWKQPGLVKWFIVLRPGHLARPKKYNPFLFLENAILLVTWHCQPCHEDDLGLSIRAFHAWRAAVHVWGLTLQSLFCWLTLAVSIVPIVGLPQWDLAGWRWKVQTNMCLPFKDLKLQEKQSFYLFSQIIFAACVYKHVGPTNDVWSMCLSALW